MSDAIFFAPLRVPLVDVQTGLMNREWYLFFQSMYLRVGGVSAPSNDNLIQSIFDLQKGPPEELGAAELLALQTSASDATAQLPPFINQAAFDDLLGELRQTRDAVAELTKTIQGLQQGTVS